MVRGTTEMVDFQSTIFGLLALATAKIEKGAA
jgi:hypothetical protein